MEGKDLQTILNLLDSVYKVISHPGFWTITMIILLLVSLTTRYLYIAFGNEIFRVINSDFTKALSIIGIAILSQIIAKCF